MTVPVLELSHISKKFGATGALHDVSLCISPGEIVGLLGDNGAGKSTLVKIIAGNFAPSSGSIRFCGKEVCFSGPADARSVGIEVVYQDLALVDNLTAVANVFLGREITKQFGPFKFLDHQTMEKKAVEIFDGLRLTAMPNTIVKLMSGGQRQAVAVARTRLADAKLVIMDEPTSAISVRQVTEVLDLLSRLRDQGVSVLLISHRMADVFSVCDKVVVMRHGKKAADKPVVQSSLEEITALVTGVKDVA